MSMETLNENQEQFERMKAELVDLASLDDIDWH